MLSLTKNEKVGKKKNFFHATVTKNEAGIGVATGTPVPRCLPLDLHVFAADCFNGSPLYWLCHMCVC